MKIRAYCKVLMYIDTDKVTETNITKRNKQIRQIADKALRSYKENTHGMAISAKDFDLNAIEPYEIMTVEVLD